MTKLESGKLLVVDDDRSMLATLCLLLKAEGYDVSEASSQKEAISRVHRESFDLVVTDLRMERDDSGIQVLKEVKQLCSKTQVLIVTAYGSIGTAIEAMRQGAFDYITTPCDNEEIVVKVAKALQCRAESRSFERGLTREVPE